jgi:type VI protein secretion system component VasF
LVVLSIVTWRTVAYAESARLAGRYTPSLQIPHWPFIYIFALGTAIFTLVIAYEASQHLTELFKGNRRLASAIFMGVIVLIVALFFSPVFSETG